MLKGLLVTNLETPHLVRVRVRVRVGVGLRIGVRVRARVRPRIRVKLCGARLQRRTGRLQPRQQLLSVLLQSIERGAGVLSGKRE